MALTIAHAALNFRIEVPERSSSVGWAQSATVPANHIAEFVATYSTGTGANAISRVWSGYNSSSSASTYDLQGSSLLSIADGSAVTFPIVTTLMIRNHSTTTGQYLTIGAGSNPWITWLGATGDAIVLGPGGVFVLHSPIDGYATTASTGDVLTVTPATGTIAHSVMILGRAS